MHRFSLSCSGISYLFTAKIIFIRFALKLQSLCHHFCEYLLKLLNFIALIWGYVKISRELRCKSCFQSVKNPECSLLVLCCLNALISLFLFVFHMTNQSGDIADTWEKELRVSGRWVALTGWALLITTTTKYDVIG